VTAPTGLAARLTAALDNLGGTPDQVADRLRALGIKGDRIDPDSCPVAVYLTGLGLARDGEQICVTSTQVAVRKRNRVSVSCSVSTPEPVREFIRAFDRGVHLDLEAVA
jgi:hypothetical protein